MPASLCTGCRLLVNTGAADWVAKFEAAGPREHSFFYSGTCALLRMCARSLSLLSPAGIYADVLKCSSEGSTL